jgi:uncharacterized protein YkwD
MLVAGFLVLLAGHRPSAAATPDGEEQAFLGFINDHRAANGLGALSLSPQLQEATRWMSQDMAANDYISHTDSLGRDPFERMADFGYDYNTWKARPHRRRSIYGGARPGTTPTC